jgi:hypothetical protein
MAWTSGALKTPGDLIGLSAIVCGAWSVCTDSNDRRKLLSFAFNGSQHFCATKAARVLVAAAFLETLAAAKHIDYR